MNRNIMKRRAVEATKGESSFYVTLTWQDKRGVSTSDEAAVAYYKVWLGGAHGPQTYNANEGRAATRRFAERVSELVLNGYNIKQMKVVGEGFTTNVVDLGV